MRLIKDLLDADVTEQVIAVLILAVLCFILYFLGVRLFSDKFQLAKSEWNCVAYEREQVPTMAGKVPVSMTTDYCLVYKRKE